MYKDGVVPKDKKRIWDKNYRLRHLDRLKEYHKEYFQKTKDANKSNRMEYQRIWRIKNRDKYLDYCKRYDQTPNRRLCRRVNNLKRQRQLNDLDVKTVQLVYEDNIKMYGTLTCYLCNNPIMFGNDNLEHKIPLSRGGNSLYENLAIACKECNGKKGNKTVEEYKEVLCPT